MNSGPGAGPLRFERSGEITHMTVPWFFQGIRSASKTGVAMFEYIRDQSAEKVVKKVYFKNGDVVFAASNLNEERLGDYLLRLGKITQAQFDASTELLKKTNKKQGAILVELGFIAPQDLVTGVKNQVKEVILGLFAVRRGSYRFDEGPLPAADIIPLQMSTGNLILDGINSLAWDVIRKSLPSPDTVLRPSTDPSTLFQSAHLSEDQNAVLSLIDGKRSIEELCGQSGIGDFNCMKALYVLLALRMAEAGRIGSDEEREFARQAVKEAVKAHEPAKTEAPAEAAEAVAAPEQIRQAFAALPGQDHYQVMGIGRLANQQEVKSAYLRLAKLYHPDRHFDLKVADMKAMLDTLFSRIHDAYEVLGNLAARAAYDVGRPAETRAAPQPPQAAQFEEKRPEEYQEHYKEKAARAAEWFNTGMKDFKTGNFWGAAESLSWAVRLDPIKAPYFFFYGLSLSHIPRRKHEAEENLMKALELDPTKVEYHLELGNLYVKSGLKAKALGVLNNALVHHPNSPKIMNAIAAAGRQEEAPARDEHAGREAGGKAERAETAAGPSPTPEKREDASVNARDAARGRAQFDTGMKEFRVKNFWGAVDAFSAAIRLDRSNAAYHYYHGLALCFIPRRRHEAEESLRRAVELDPRKAEYHLELGNFYLKSDLKAKALGVLKNALLILPDAVKIKDALKAAGGTAPEQAEDEKKAGLFTKIFKPPK